MGTSALHRSHFMILIITNDPVGVFYYSYIRNEQQCENKSQPQRKLVLDTVVNDAVCWCKPYQRVFSMLLYTCSIKHFWLEKKKVCKWTLLLKFLFAAEKLGDCCAPSFLWVPKDTAGHLVPWLKVHCKRSCTMRYSSQQELSPSSCMHIKAGGYI